MATKTETVDERPAPTEPVAAVETRPRNRGLAIGSIVAASVLTAGVLFGGGVLLGASLPDAHPAPFAEAQHPRGPLMQGEGPQQPGLQQQGPRGPHDGQNDGPQGGSRDDAPHPPAPDELDSDEPDAANP